MRHVADDSGEKIDKVFCHLLLKTLKKKVRSKFTRLLQIAFVLNVESIEDLSLVEVFLFHLQDAQSFDLNFKFKDDNLLTSSEIHNILRLRVDIVP